MPLVPPLSVADTLDDPRWVPLRVTAHLTEPIVTDTDPMHFDGPLSWCGFLEHQEQGLSLPPKSTEYAVDFEIGLATWTMPPSRPVCDERLLASDGASVWGWACSAAYAPALLGTLAHTRRPVTVRELARFTTDKIVHTGAGPYKARNVPHAAVFAPEVTWWCLGDPDRVRGLLGRLRGLGRLSRHGHGAVSGVEVAVDPQARERWRWREWPSPDSPHIGACRAPYHHPTRRMPTSPAGPPPWV